MSLWGWVVAAALACYLLKLVGYLVPANLVRHSVVARATTAMTVGLLTSLVVMNTVGSGQAIHLDARLAALGAAAVALWLRAPYIVVVIVGALAAALARMAGWG